MAYKEGLKMECNKRSRNIRYVIFRDSNLDQISNVLLNQTRSFYPYFYDRYRKLKMFISIFGPITFLRFGRLVKLKCHTSLRMALICFSRIQIPQPGQFK